MKKEFYKQVNNLFWAYRWTYGENPIVCFSNPKVFTNIIYSAKELEGLMVQGANNGHATLIPQRVLMSAYLSSQNASDIQSQACMVA